MYAGLSKTLVRKVKLSSQLFLPYAGEDITEDFTFRLMGTFRDCLGRQSDEAVRLEMVELLGRVVGDRGEGVGGKTVKVLNSRGEYFQPKIVKHIFYQQ